LPRAEGPRQRRAARPLITSRSRTGERIGYLAQSLPPVTPGTSALFALTSGAVQDKVADEFRGTEAELIRTNLSDEQEAQLREAFGLED
jgi:uncharacterized membrane protein